MYSNIGQKIKTTAAVFAGIGIIAAIAAGVALISIDLAGIGIIVLIGGSLLSWISSFMVYGFGQLVENSDLLVSQIGKKQSMSEWQTEEERKTEEKNQMLFNLQDDLFDNTEYIDFSCPLCGEKVSYTKGTILSNAELFCPNCSRSFSVENVFMG